MKNEFYYKVISFMVDDTKEINKELMARDLDATDVISIIHDETHDHWHKVFCRKKV